MEPLKGCGCPIASVLSLLGVQQVSTRTNGIDSIFGPWKLILVGSFLEGYGGAHAHSRDSGLDILAGAIGREYVGMTLI